ncbi:zinc ribbon domain-containing protein [uncultured Methanobrevibacter sp.]|uniref:zinc ribbon domain-containing protein n=1 Tax=uncultured Methanobrevibacter sp. TaxID=253161 RepID=UPI0025E17BB9|nr:zinc ribbon domain-containing protein [uncultured Methanobrevibacter sp.]
MKIKCPICGTENKKDKTYCKVCGASLNTDPDYLEDTSENDFSLTNALKDMEKSSSTSSNDHNDNEKIAAEKYLEALEEEHGLSSEKTEDTIIEGQAQEDIDSAYSQENLNSSFKEKIEQLSDDYIIVEHAEEETIEEENLQEEYAQTEDPTLEEETTHKQHTDTEEIKEETYLIEHTPKEATETNHDQEYLLPEYSEEEYIQIEHSPEETIEEETTKEYYIQIEHTPEDIAEEDKFQEEAAIQEEIEKQKEIADQDENSDEDDEEYDWVYDIYPDHSSEVKTAEEHEDNRNEVEQFIKKPKEKGYKNLLKFETKSLEDKNIDKNSFRYVHRKGIMVLGVLILLAIVGTMTMHYIDENTLNYLSASNSEPGQYTNNIISFKLPATWEKYNITEKNVIGSYKSEKDGHKILLSVYQSKVSGRTLDEIKSSTEELDIRSGALVNQSKIENIKHVKSYDVLSREGANDYEYRTIGFIKDNKEYAFLFVSDDIDTFNEDINDFKKSLEFY